MTAYYVDTANGLDSATGLIGAPWKSFEYGYAMASAADTLNVVAPATTPAQSMVKQGAVMTLNKNVTVQGTSATDLAYFSPIQDLTDGVAWGEQITDGGQEAWLSSSAKFVLSGFIYIPATGTYSQDVPATGSTGAISTKIASGTVYPYINYTFVLPKGSTATLAFKTKASGSRFTVTLQDLVSTEYWNSTTQAWQVASFNLNPTNVTTWTGVTKTVLASTATSRQYALKFLCGTGSTLDYWLDDVSLSVTTSRAWTNVGGGVYSLDGVCSSAGSTTSVPQQVLVANNTDFTSQGVEALTGLRLAASLAACLATTDTFWWDAQLLTINIGARSIASTTIKVCHSLSAINTTTAASTLKYLHASAAFSGFLMTVSNTLHGCKTKAIYGTAFDTTANAPVLYDCVASDNTTKDGFVSRDAASAQPIYYRCIAYGMPDDGFQSAGSAGFTAYNCIARDTAPAHADGNSQGFVCEDAGSHMHIYNCSAANLYGSGIRRDTTTTATTDVYNCAVANCGLAGGGQRDIEMNGTGTMNVYNNIGGSFLGSIVNGVNGNVIGDPSFADPANGDLRLATGSIAYRSGKYLATAKVDFRGRRRQVPPSIGAYEPSSGDACPVARTARA